MQGWDVVLQVSGEQKCLLTFLSAASLEVFLQIMYFLKTSTFFNF